MLSLRHVCRHFFPPSHLGFRFCTLEQMVNALTLASRKRQKLMNTNANLEAGYDTWTADSKQKSHLPGLTE
jgi:hypothetical protein